MLSNFSNKKKAIAIPLTSRLHHAYIPLILRLHPAYKLAYTQSPQGDLRHLVAQTGVFIWLKKIVALRGS